MAGWQASYIGEANNDWDFSWREIHYEPTLYQHWCRAWSCVGTIATEDMINVALIDHSTDEFFPDEQPVVVQVQPNFGASQSQKTVYLGSQDEGTRPFLLGTSVPAVVFNREGPEGPVVLEAEPPDYLTWTANPLYDEPTDPPASVYVVVSSRYGNYIAFDQTQSGSPLNRLWRDLGEGWERADASGILPEMFFGHLAASDDALFYLWPGGGQHLYISTDQGTNFTEMLHDIGFDVVSSMSVGERAEMPLYIGDHLNNTGRIICRYRHPLDENWYAAPISYGTVLDVVADPCVPWLLWARVNEPGNNRETIRMYYYFPTEPPNVSLGDAKWWVPDGSHAGEYSVRDIRVSALDEHRRIMDVTLQTPNSNDADVDHTVVKRWDFNVPGTLPPYLPSTTAGTWLLAGDVVIPAEHTVTIEPGTVLLCAPMAKLIVEGSLIVNGNVEKEVVFKRVAQDQSDAWEGLYVEGDCELNYCTIEGASIGIESHKAVSLEMDHCTVRDCGVGFYAYQPAGSAEPQISYCTFMGNDHEGISLLETAGAAITNCEITGNGDTGILLVDSYAKLVENRVRENGYPESYYGLECFGSSPVLYCNEFENNMKGEVALFNQSYPVLWNNNGAGGGNNTFLNDSKTLVTMYDSYPLLMKGENNFYLGTQGYFLADMSAKPTAQDISGNYWNPSLSLSLLYPPDPDVWKWWSTNPTSSSCGSGILDFEGGPEELFEQGFYAEMNDNPEQAEASYTSLLTTYPDSTLALAAAARLFELSRQADSSHANLQDYLFTLAETHAEDTVLAKSLRAVATRLWVQEHIYGNPLDYYTGIMNDPPTEVDSVFAALDHAVTTLVQQYEEGGGGGLDCAGPTVSVSSLRTLRSEVGTALPEAPLNEHEGYSLPPSDYVLEQNYPNPFNAMTTIRYYLPEETRVQVALYNLMGQKVADLVDDVQPTGYHTVNWNAVALASGVYVYQLKAGKFSDAKKMVLIR
ncbi:right-handed parallel beta-helix repeat-containing protein [bacterium]|nr:right-handed parallel beta-helix repeat-containing protein [bacterium]